MVRRSPAVLLLLVAACALAHAAAPEPLGVQPGLWETTYTTEKGPARPTNLDRLDPRQRAEVEKKLAARVQRESRTVRGCLRPEQIRNADAFVGDAHHGACKRTFRIRTAHELVADLECSGANRLTGTVEIRAPGPDTLSGTVDTRTVAANGLQLLTHTQITARFVAADCGSAPAGLGRSH